MNELEVLEKTLTEYEDRGRGSEIHDFPEVFFKEQVCVAGIMMHVAGFHYSDMYNYAIHNDRISWHLDIMEVGKLINEFNLGCTLYPFPWSRNDTHTKEENIDYLKNMIEMRK